MAREASAGDRRAIADEGDVVVADTAGLEQMDASELHARRVNAKEVLTPMKGEKFKFSIEDGTVKFSG